ncbi:MAG: S49 family peptidase, partial [Rhodospirillales bacterium]|nr:S49 family peptidase [Rhodospirillales bacterium]
MSRLLARLTFRRPPPVVSVVRLSGVIGRPAMFGGRISMEAVAPVLQRAFRQPGLKAVALEINSPGGSAAQSALIHNRIRALAAERDVPVMAFVEDVAASGGYWLAAAADEIFVDDNSILGSIGVIYSGFGFHEAIAKLGVERRLYTAGEKKSLLDPFLAV